VLEAEADLKVVAMADGSIKKITAAKIFSAVEDYKKRMISLLLESIARRCRASNGIAGTS
jgi:hypothetical protein